MSKLKILELFGGIGACSNALRNLDVDFEVVDYVECVRINIKKSSIIQSICGIINLP